MYKRISFERLGISRSSGSNDSKPNASNMKMMIVVALAFVAVASALPVGDVEPKLIEIIRSESSQQPDGSYSFSFDTEDGTNREETGELKEALDEDNKPHVVITVRGSYSYTDEEGKPETVNYYADETGYHAEGPSIPKNTPSRR